MSYNNISFTIFIYFILEEKKVRIRGRFSGYVPFWGALSHAWAKPLLGTYSLHLTKLQIIAVFSLLAETFAYHRNTPSCKCHPFLGPMGPGST